MKLLISLLVLVIFCCCAPWEDKATQTTIASIAQPAIATTIANKPYHEPIVSVWLDSMATDQQLKASIAQHFDPQVYGVDTQSTLRKLYHDIPLVGFGNSSIYEVRTADNLPSNMARYQCLVWNKNSHKMTLLPIESCSLLQMDLNTTAYYIGGFYTWRGLGTYLVYGTADDVFYDIFNAGEACEAGVLWLSNRTYDCVSYEPFFFSVKNNDLNADGYADLQFEGTINIYCTGLEEGFGRDKRQPIKKQQMSILFFAQPHKQNPSWELQDTTLCLLMKEFSGFLH